jgi:sulfur-carrier protein
MAISVEFYGIARQRAGASRLSLELSSDPMALSDVLDHCARRFPLLEGDVINAGRLHATLTANVDGERFVTDPTTPIRDGQSLLILSADAGG